MTTTVAADAASMGCVKRVEVGMAYILFAPVDVKPKPPARGVTWLLQKRA